MKVSNLAKKIIAMLCVLALILPTPISVIAKIENTAANTKLRFGISVVHTSKTLDNKTDTPFGYATDSSAKPTYRIYSGNNDYETTVLCLNKDLRYPMENGQSNAEYTSLGEATETTLKQAKSDIDSDKAQKIQWLIKNAILPEDSEAMRDYKLSKIFESDLNSETENKLTLDQLKSVLTEDDLVFAMQFSLWELTNNIRYGAPQGTRDGTQWAALNGGIFGKYKGTYIQKIIEFYSTELSKSERKDIIPSKTEGESTITIVNGNTEGVEEKKAKVVESGIYAYIGPFKIDGAQENEDYTVKITLLTNDDKESNSAFFILDKAEESGKRLSCTKADLNGKDFYIQVKRNTNAKKVKIDITTDLSAKKVTGYVWQREAEDQPLLSIEREEEPGKDIEDTFNFEITNEKEYDVALRKFITQVRRPVEGGQWQEIWKEGGEDTRTPVTPTLDKKQPEGSFNQYEYKHKKDPLKVQVGDRITYTIEIINEMGTTLQVTEVTDFLPPSGLKYVSDDQTNITNKWQYDEGSNKATTDYFSTFSPDSELSVRKVTIVCEVTEDAQGKIITNIAEITKFKEKDGGEIQNDIDSIPGNVKLPETEEEWENYKGNNNKDELDDSDYYYKGQEDDDDFEKIEVELEPGEYNLEIEKVDKDDPSIKLANAEFTVTLPSKETETITTGNEGTATTQNITINNTESESLTIYETKAPAGYELIDETYIIDISKGIVDGHYALTDAALRDESDIATFSRDGNNLKLTIENEKKPFDLSLRKFITQIGNEKITDRVPVPTLESGDFEYKHSKEPLTVVQGQRVVYKIRVYNEGKQDGYAAEIKDDIPEGLTFLPEDETNTKYGWKMYDSQGKETQNVSEAVEIRTTYLSKEESEARNEDNLLKAYDESTGLSEDNPDHRDVEVAFKVTMDSISSKNKTIINTAEISKDQDKDGNEIDDIDSKPDDDDPDEDDIDKEYLELKYFDLSLLKYLSKVIVTEDGVTKETETGYDGTENPDPIVKVEINKNKLDKTEIKYVFTIKITNEGEIEGYATEITDRIPVGLEFYEEDNTQYKWKVKEDGIVTTDYLKDTLLQPGQSATVPIVLRWIKSDKNLGQKTNVAEISADDNPYDAPDIDSTPNNNKDGEDDQDSAPVILSISTGYEDTYIVLAVTLTSLMGLGVFAITKYVILG